MHWLHGGAFVVALLSGLALYLAPAEELIGHRFVVRVVHISSGLIFAAAPLMAARLGDWRAIKRDFAQAQWWDDEDRKFFSTWLSAEEAPAGRFNAGQKANMMFTVSATLFFLISGVVMWQYFRFDDTVVANAGFLHDSLTVAITIVWLGHMWYALGNPRTRHSMRGMLTGSVDRVWAGRVHPRWLAEVDGHSTEGGTLLHTNDEQGVPGA